ncbi:TIGR04086 family membrane protein [Clostridium sp. BJN0001]|uniref:TIGR04086 family membrane protein n=1 Tax=Clostridium sp. BJN0001 TaxID=2930219 RepID=UPI001FD11D77|nr:TIGR04086 family membrane protein [Clostridium sp. BJN0001]
MKNKFIISVSKGIASSIFICAISIFFLSAVMSKFTIKVGILNAVYVIISLLSLTLGAVIAARNNNNKGWMTGLVVAIGYYIMIFLISAFLYRSIEFGSMEIIKLFGSIAVGILAGMLGINTK